MEESYEYANEFRKQGRKNQRYTVEPLIKDTPNKGHNRINLSIKDTL